MQIGNMNAGDFIRKVRKQRGLTQAALAADIIDASSLSKFENGVITPPHYKVAQLIERLGYPSDLIYLDKNEKKNEINRLQATHDTKATAHLIAELENDDAFMDNPRNRQFIITAKVGNMIMNNE